MISIWTNSRTSSLSSNFEGGNLRFYCMKCIGKFILCMPTWTYQLTIFSLFQLKLRLVSPKFRDKWWWTRWKISKITWSFLSSWKVLTLFFPRLWTIISMPRKRFRKKGVSSSFKKIPALCDFTPVDKVICNSSRM